ncbi:MAG: TonB-dependent receptor plug domain-containing protein, partial [Flavobacteriaceae bacterium]|nr:TonB-dependent receptor plug domain-containing protein [Flavobacteriaceae bacterium]
MKLSFLPGIFLGIILNTNAQTITIKDQETKNPLDLVTLISENPRATAVSNADGQADISAFKGSKTIQIRSLGYKTSSKSYAELESANFIIYLVPSNLNLDEVTLAATRWQQVSDNIPARIIAVSPAEAALQNPQTAADLLGISGEVFVQKSQQAGGSPMIRGFATNRLLYAVDGVRMNTAIFRAGNLQNVINLDPFAIENTAILFGPGSVIYGSDAIGGVMSFTSLKPQFSLNEKTLITGKATSRYSSANKEKTGHLDINIGWKKWAFISSFSRWDFDNLKQGSHGPEEYVKPYYVQRQHDTDVIIDQQDPLLQIPSAYTQFNTMQKVRFKPDDKWDFQYGFHYSKTSTYGRYDRHNRVRNDLPRYAEWNYGPQVWMMNNLSMIYNRDRILFDQMAVRLAQQYFEESRIDRSLNNTNRNTQTENVDAYSINFDLTKTLNDRHTRYYGAEFVTNIVSSKGEITNIVDNTRQEGPSRYPESNWNSLAV